MRECANFSENRLLSYLSADNAALGTSVSFLRQSCSVLVKTDPIKVNGMRSEVKTEFDHSSTLPRKASLADIEQARVYFIAGAGLIKIGVSTNVQSRFRAIRNSSPVPVELLGTVPGGTLQEGFLHHSFPHLRRHGEWFEDTPELRAHVDLCLKEQRAIRTFGPCLYELAR